MELIVLKKLINLICELHVKWCEIVETGVEIKMAKLTIVYIEI